MHHRPLYHGHVGVKHLGFSWRIAVTRQPKCELAAQVHSCSNGVSEIVAPRLGGSAVQGQHVPTVVRSVDNVNCCAPSEFLFCF